MTPRLPKTVPSPRGAFTLVELLVVIAIMTVLMTLLVPAFNAMKGGNDLTKATYEIAGVLEQARTYAIAHNTYVWIGFYEEDVSATAPTAAVPPYPGKGRVVIAAVSSKDGTQIFGSSDPPAALPAANLISLGKALKLENIHLADLGAPTGGDRSKIDGRPGFPYLGGTQDRISSDSSDKTNFPFVAQNYTFQKTIRFNPRGEVDLNGAYVSHNLAEIGVRPTHRSTVDTASQNVAAIQITGLSGDVKIYRR